MVSYSDGNSFGKSECTEYETITVVKDLEIAKALAKYVRSQDDDEHKKLDILLDDGQHIVFEYCPWTYYFATLNAVKVECLTFNNGGLSF